MSLASTSMNLFFLTTIIYFIVYYFTTSSAKNIITIIYYCLIIITQFLLIYLQSKELCGTPQIQSVFLWGLIPWFFLFFGLITLLKVFPAWKSPFSNTIGFLFTKLLGITALFNSLLKSNYKSNDQSLNKIMQNIYEDQSILINEITPSNFDNAINKLKPLFNTSASDYSSNIDKLKKLVLLKDEVSRFIWYILTGGLVVSISNMGVTTTKCEKNVSLLNKDLDNYNQQISENEKINKNKLESQKKYYIRD